MYRRHGPDPAPAGAISVTRGAGADGVPRAFSILCANAPRQTATAGQELPPGVLTWTRDAKRLQRHILNGWT